MFRTQTTYHPNPNKFYLGNLAYLPFFKKFR